MMRAMPSTRGRPRSTTAAGATDAPETKAAEKAVADLRAARAPSAELGRMREEFSTLQRENRELRRDMDDLKKRLDALAAASATNSPASQVVPGTKPPRRETGASSRD